VDSGICGKSHAQHNRVAAQHSLLFSQLQATVLGLLAALMAIALGWMTEGQMPFNHAILLCSISLATTFMASLLQGKATASPLLYLGHPFDCKHKARWTMIFS